MSLSPASLRQAIEGAITAALGPAAAPPVAKPQRVASLAYDKFPGADLRNVEAASFAVGLLDTSGLPDRQRRQAGGTPVTTNVGVRFTWLLRSDHHVEDQDDALDREAAIVALVSSTSTADMQRPRFLSVSRRESDSGKLFIGDLKFACVHVYPL